MIYKFIDNFGSFVVKGPQRYNCYFPLVDRDGKILSSISANLSGDIKRDNDHFLTPPASIEDLRSNLLCRRDFFIGVGHSCIRASIPHPSDTLEAGFLYHKITKKVASLKIEVLNFVPFDLGVEVMWVKITNTSRQAKEIIPTSFIPLYGRAEKNLRDHRHVSSLLNRVELDKFGILLKPSMIFDEKGHRLNKTIYYSLGCDGGGSAPIGQFPSLDYFYGEGDLLYPDAVLKGIPAVTKRSADFDGKEAAAAFRFAKKRLSFGQQADYIIVSGITEDKAKIRDSFLKLNSLAKVKRSLESTKNFWRRYLSDINIDFGDKDYNNWLLWVRLQPTLRRLFGCSFLPHFDYGKGGRGWRDLWQDALALLLTEPDKARQIILDSFKGVRLDGSNATIITKDGGFCADRNKINRVWMDHGVWPYLTLKFYINKTGDLGILLRDCEYFRDHQLMRAKSVDADFRQSDFILRDKKGKIYKGSILEHILVQNLVQFFNVGRHNISRLENADWNDGLDMASDNGESAAFGFMYAHNLGDLCAFLRELKNKRKTIKVYKELLILIDRLSGPINYNNYLDKQKLLEKYFISVKNISGQSVNVDLDWLIADLKAKSAHIFSWLNKFEWLKEGFFNGYYDNGSGGVEGRFGSGVKMMLASQVFAIMSGGAGKSQINSILKNANRYLKDQANGGFRLNTDFGQPDLKLGRAFGFAYGDKENGAFFNHMCVMFANALYSRGFIKEGFDVINSVYSMAVNPHSGIYPVLPEYFNSQGRGMYLYLTGSASWYIYTIIEQVLGIKFVLGDILLDPKLCGDNFSKGSKIEVSFSLKNKPIKIIFLKNNKVNKTYTIGRLLLNNKKISSDSRGFIIKEKDLLRHNNIIRAYLA